MKDYKKLLLAVELDSKADALPAKKAHEICQEFKADLYLVHAIEHLSSYGAAYGIAAGADIEEMLLENAQELMQKLGTHLGVPPEKQIIKVGPAKVIILDEAKDIHADLIVVGSHGRHGLRLILGSTANAVLHGASCDVLAVRLKS